MAAPHQVVHGFAPPLEDWLPGHRGVDLAGRVGEPVLASGAGVVAFAGRVAGVPVVSVAHPGGLLTTYEPVRAAVVTGRPVRRGQVLGRLTVRGSHCAPAACLHWGLRRGTDYLDPVPLVAPGRVRLLPLRGEPVGWAPAPAGALALGSAGLLGSTLLVRRRRSGRRTPGPNGSAGRR
jgi:murein DD-endopeptidase MepM/ murein hydrolase activator NlpD